ncbi:hypothetical protein LSUE1_G002863 [Lachnellula suecica]|uniref:NB-ARC domain-containing protein n=1 Tax=Lachnellula suecica TaxID=602035 RepID=A0A8T9CFP4_9HELO|nr:hypothetical protein LSUE1_G002863 [Lachnellula suecica]
MDEILSRMETLSRFTERRSSRMEESPRRPSTLSMLSESRDSRDSRDSRKVSQQEELTFPVIVRPSTRTSRFFDRTDVVGKMNSFFSKSDPQRSFLSLAIYGLGGVGKSSVAMRFAEGKLDRRELDCMFWIHSEKPVSIRQSFTDIAMRLKLPDARPKDHEENHVLVLNWLQQTQCRWLLVYDNAEDMDLLRDYWPSASRGQALITTRNRSFGFEIADGGLEIHTWDTETGSRFLLHLLSTDISEELKEDEVVSATELSHKLSGHALAISHMAGLIHRRAWSIAEFMKIYDQHPSEMHGVSGNNSINALWDFAFKSLDPQSRAILGVLCFVAPDNIPQSLFELEDPANLPELLHFCSDDFHFSEATECLLTLALIKRDKASRTFSIHRLVQTSFKYYMTPEQRNQSFDDAAVLISHAFPRRDSNVAQLYLMWERCALFLPHVLSLKDRFREEKKANPLFTAPRTYCELSNACQRQVYPSKYTFQTTKLIYYRYLLEINAYSELEDLIEVNNMAISTLPQGAPTIGLQGSLTSHTGQLLIRLGRPSEGVQWLKKSYEIRSHDVPFNPRESAWAAENAANGISTMNDFKEGVKWLEKSRYHWLEWSNKQDTARGEWPACIMKSLGVSLTWAGELKLAQDLINQALQQIESKEPYNWAMAAYTHFSLGTIDRHNRKLDSAEAHFMEAQNLWGKGDQLRTDPFNAACMYRLGCTALDQGKVEAAVKHLKDAMVLTEMRKASMVAEHARTIFKLAEALEQEPREAKEAARLRQEAEHLLYLRDPNSKNSGVEHAYDSLVNILWR